MAQEEDMIYFCSRVEKDCNDMDRWNPDYCGYPDYHSRCKFLVKVPRNSEKQISFLQVLYLRQIKADFLSLKEDLRQIKQELNIR
ncbi:hypothetical protein HDR61_02320 [bacterium]|nr:hypothetical protein [bacterium]